MNELLNLFPFIQQTKINLEQQNKFLNKVTLTGKINALEVAENLFEFTDKTILIFEELKTELINALLERNIHKQTNELKFKSQTAIDILIRNLFERTADVGFLATDSVIIDFLTSDTISKDIMQKRLQDYVSKYSVYNEIVIFNLDGEAQVNLNPHNSIKHTQDSIITEALESESYVEVYKKSDIFVSQDKTLMYAQKITNNGVSIGVLCLCFKFKDELNTIFSNLNHNNETIAILDKDGILESNAKHISKLPYKEAPYQIINNKSLSVMSKTNGYQGYFGIEDWYSVVISCNLNDMNNATQENEIKKRDKKDSVLDEQLLSIISKANNLIEDIADVIINGELIASKRKVYLLTPILDNLRDISSSLLNSIKMSIENLENVVRESLISDVKMASYLAIDIMDRNLYERANDSRWWALTPVFKSELMKDSIDTQLLNDTLLYINDLYTVYTNIFIYDKDSKIIASSKDANIIEKRINEEFITQTLQNRNPQNYFVSDFTKSDLYDNRPTYIYSASIENRSSIIGGVGVVFDAEYEFKQMLNDSFPQGKKGFSAFVDVHRTIIATNSTELHNLDTLDIDPIYFIQSSGHSITDFINYNDKRYIMGIVASHGYREYKNSDNYKNCVFAVTFIEI